MTWFLTTEDFVMHEVDSRISGINLELCNGP